MRFGGALRVFFTSDESAVSARGRSRRRQSEGQTRHPVLPRGLALAFTRYCRYQYYIAYIVTRGGRGGTLYCATVWAMGWGGGRRGVPKLRGCLQIIVLIRVQKPRHKTISCKGQVCPPPLGVSIGRLSGVGVLWDCVLCSPCLWWSLGRLC